MKAATRSRLYGNTFRSHVKPRPYHVSIVQWSRGDVYSATRAPGGRIFRRRQLRFSSDPSCRDSNRLADRSRKSTVFGPVQGRQDRRPHGLIFVGNGETRVNTEIHLLVK